ncbi:MAG: SpoIIE family protein phosphatase [Alistipes senegalensis]|nr:SpoIIE family protein phosphatase [Alistipes senegalensis]
MKRKKIRKKKSAVSFWAFIASMGAGYMLSGTDMAGISSFADISIAGAVPLPMSTAVLTGSFLHSIAGHTTGRDIVRIISMVIIIIAKMFHEPKSNPKSDGFITAAGVFTAGTAVSALIGEIPYKLLFYMFYGGLAGFTAYSLSFILSGIKKRFVLDFSTTTGCAYAVVYTVMLASLCSVRIPYINIGLIIGTTITLCGAYYYCHTGGVMCGALTACGAFLSSVDCGMTVVLLPAAALLTGYLNRQKNTTSAICFVGINFALMVLTGVTRNSIYSMIDIICAAVIFIVISPAYSDKWLTTGNGSTSALPDIINARMNFIADTVHTVRTESEKISGVLNKKHEKNITTEDVVNAVCTDCSEKIYCWKNNSHNTKTGFLKLSAMSEISAENFPYEIRDCIYKEGLIKFYRKIYAEKARERLNAIRCADNMELLSEQMRTIEEIISTSGRRIDMRYSAPVSKIIKNKLNKFGFMPSEVIAYYNDKNRLHAEIYFSRTNTPENFTRVCDLVSDELKIPLESIQPVSSGRQTRIRLFEKPKYKTDVYSTSICAENSENGDTSAVFGDGAGREYIILSDGMGSGKNAAVESRMVVKMFKNLIGCGVEYPAAVKMINSVMLTKSPEETFATLDAACIDLETCALTLIKSGASATLIRHRGNVMKIMSPTFPIGIYSKSEISTSECEFEENDIIIMFSDGINESEYRFIKELLLSSDDLKKIVDEICAKADVFNPTMHSDDITVIGIRVEKQNI